MNYQAAMFYLTAVMTAINIGVGILNWWNSRDKITATRFKEVEDRITKAEGTLSSLPMIEKKAEDAAKAMGRLEQTIGQGLANLKNSMTKAIADLRVEFDRRETCGNHQRMEKNDTELFQTLRTLHGDLQKVIGGIESMKESMKEQIGILMEHHINGGK